MACATHTPKGHGTKPAQRPKTGRTTMETTSMIALSRQAVLRREMTVVANNIANMNTGGFKGEKMLFVQHLSKNPNLDGMAGRQLAFVRDIATVRDLSPGPLEKTGNPLDLAIQDDGYFVVQTEDGDRYTRAGRFQLDSGGQMVTLTGDPVLSDAGQPIFFAPEEQEIIISGDGTVSSENGPIGKLRVVQFDNPHTLKPIQNGYYQTDAEAIDLERPFIAQGMLEQSNVEPVIEMTNMIEVSRSYQSISKFIEKEDDRIRRMMKDLVGGQ